MKKIMLVLVLVLFLSFHNAGAATYECSSCEECTAYIQNSSSGDVIKLNRDLQNISGDCIELNVSNITFDCQFHVIEGHWPGFMGVGIYNGLFYVHEVTIQNCNIKNFQYGIILNTMDSNFTDLVVSNNYVGILFKQFSAGNFRNIITEENEIYDVTGPPGGLPINEFNITGSGGRPIGIYVNTNVTIRNQEFSQLILTFAHNSVIENVTVRGSDKFKNNGIDLYYTHNTTLIDVNSSENYNGMSFLFSNNNTIERLTATHNKFSGMNFTFFSDNNLVKDSRIEYNEFCGLIFNETWSTYNNIFFNNIFRNEQNFCNNYFEQWMCSFNTSLDCTKTNIIGGPCMGGNYWTDPDGSNFSDECTDADHNGICDSAYNVFGGVYDYLPLTPNWQCVENWVCGTWSACLNGTQQRTCYDSNGCGRENETQSQECYLEASTSPPATGPKAPVENRTEPSQVVEEIEEVFDEVVPEEPAEIIVNETRVINVTRVMIKVKEKVQNAKMKLKKIDPAPAERPPSGVTYETFRVETEGINDTNIESAAIHFKVRKSWITERGASYNDVVLKRKKDDESEWRDLKTELESTDDEYYHFNATTPGFSVFAVVLKVSGCNNNGACESELGESSENCPGDCLVQTCAPNTTRCHESQVQVCRATDWAGTQKRTAFSDATKPTNAIPHRKTWDG
jgi:PGF-pre-PGF domain-containing protein